MLYEQTVEQQFRIGPTEGVLNIIEHMLIMIATMKGVMILAIAVLTYFILEMFLSKNIEIKSQSSVTEQEYSLLIKSILLMAVAVIPFIIIINNLLMGHSIGANSIILLITISIIGSIVISWILKRQLKSDDPARKKLILISTAIGIIASITSKYIAVWIQAFIIGVVNLFIKVTHIPFVYHYFLVATILNLGISFLLTSLMGSSQIAGEVNIIGSMIGGLAHGIMSRKKIAELRDTYEKENL